MKGMEDPICGVAPFKICTYLSFSSHFPLRVFVFSGFPLQSCRSSLLGSLAVLFSEPPVRLRTVF